MTDEMDAQADVVALMRAEVARQLEFAGEEATAFVLSHLQNVTYRDDIKAYLSEAQEVMRAALTLALQPRLDQLRRQIGPDALARIEAERARVEREFEAFREMQTPPTVN